MTGRSGCMCSCDKLRRHQSVRERNISLSLRRARCATRFNLADRGSGICGVLLVEGPFKIRNSST
jgi:hypothetical protein